MTSTVQAPRTVRSFSTLFIGGRWVEPAGDGVIDVVSPVTEERLATVPDPTTADIDAAVAAARRAFDHGPWPRMTPAERAAVLRRVGAEVEKRFGDMAASFTAEIGAPSAVSEAFHRNALKMWADAASLHERFAFEEERSWEGGHGVLVREPVGVVATIIPWNGPVATASLKIGPALAAGCTVVLKPAPEGPVSTYLLAEALEAAGLPEGVVSVLPGGREVGEHLVTHPGVDKVAFTGSTAAGRRIMSLCGERITRVTLELGGKSAAVIADDIPFEDVLPTLAFAGIGHSGQVCAALTRILVPRARQEELLSALVPMFEGLTVGDPAADDTVLGPLAAARQRDRVESYIRLGLDEGARLVTGGGRPAGLDRGWFVEPTVFADVRNDMRIAQEEIFGPVICVIPFDDVEEAVALANDSDYGLSGAVYARDAAEAERIARRIRTGQVSVNGWDMCVVQPFGGYKQSGLGREGNVEGLGAYLETKLIQRP
ncbi:aldehyde dehydrogenase [Prauserella rugosa]|uniref:Acyl-CoA reductase-like NAD-dependent aldehyde dehydrogenase n=1 Tax=Prauserella rugosa TaxID=43354 RepID=A0A660CBG0_9PSEU|nr:aldehyde dehydrogenase [Prauserella rugosa]KMS87328.1 aldehyde dehydrogenase [Streptomyces regensis]TWH19664.1 acyl-CoA reductase-like NAD-dependent aldehyde dehydrogenase [Prauserella rugosa]